jgi:hypothetical protein
MAQAVSRRPPTAEASGFDPVSVNVGFVVDKVALGQGFPPSTSVFFLSILFHRCSIARKNAKSNNLHLHHRVAQ